VQVTAEKRLRVRYGLWVHDGISSREACEAHWRRFTELPVADLGPPAKK